MKAATAVILCLMAACYCAASTISVLGPGISPVVNDTFTIDIEANSITDLYAFQFDLSFNPALLSAVSVIEGPLLRGGGSTVFVPGMIDNATGSVTASADTLVGAIPGVTGSGVLAAIQFMALAPGTSALNLQNLILLDSSLSDIASSASVQNGSVSISGTAAVPEPSTLSMLLSVFAIGLLKSRGKMDIAPRMLMHLKTALKCPRDNRR